MNDAVGVTGAERRLPENLRFSLESGTVAERPGDRP